MNAANRKILDRSFTVSGILSIVLLAASLLLLLGPIFARGGAAFVFRATSEFRRLQYEQFGRSDFAAVQRETALVTRARQPVFRMLDEFRRTMEQDENFRHSFRQPFRELLADLRLLLGPLPGDDAPVLLRQQYGQTRWDRAMLKLDAVLYTEEWDYSSADRVGRKIRRPRSAAFRGTPLEPLFPYLRQHLGEMLRPRLTVYWRFLFDQSKDAHFFGGIWPEMLGTIYLTLGAMLFALPCGVIAAVYLSEFAGHGKIVSLLRTCISTLAGVPSIVFALFGLAFFINTLHVSASKSVLAGSLTLALLILPTIIRAAEEAIRAVPASYREAALSLGAGRWHTVVTVILPAALPGILTGVVIGMGRAAGETAPIIFTAAVSVGQPLEVWETLSQPTPALPWNIYNLATEHEAVDEIRHVQYGMVLTLVMVVLLLNLTAVWLRARVSRKLRG